ncbi:MAG: hypothetical protein LBV69_10565 [Bacteroidales bacterium]|jgi:hydrogenase maturation factor HypF (carbamoyltransferase family)|nr:hypothetical protein [Bacteroidales bacterium]
MLTNGKGFVCAAGFMQKILVISKKSTLKEIIGDLEKKKPTTLFPTKFSKYDKTF